MDDLNRLSEYLQQGDEEMVKTLTRELIDKKTDPKDILDSGLIAGMNVIGEKFKEHEIFLPDVLLAAKAMYAGMDEIKGLLIRDGVPSQGRIVIGTVMGDLHDIGKNLVSIMLKGAGFDVIDLGTDVSPERFVDTAIKEQAGVIGMSALLTTTMPAMKNVVDIIRERKLSDKVKTIIGGAPVSEAYKNEIGADAHGYDAANAVLKVKKLFGKDR